MGLDSVIRAFQKGTEPFSEPEFEIVKPAGQGGFVYLCCARNSGPFIRKLSTGMALMLWLQISSNVFLAK